MKNKKLFLAAIIVIFLSGCATKSPYTFGGKSYKEYDQAVAAIDVFQRTKLDSVKPRSKPVYPVGKIIIPSQTELESRDSGAKKLWAYSVYHDFRSTAEMLRKRNIFGEISIEEGAGEPMPTDNSHPQIILFYPKGKGAFWRYIAKDGAVTPLFLDKSAESMADQYMYLVQTVEALASAEPQ